MVAAMNWLTNYVLPKIRAFTRKDVPDNLWKKCPACEQMLFHRELAANFEVCRNCGHHFRIGSQARFKMLFDDGAFELLELPKVAVDPLRFRDRKRYTERLRDSQAAHGPGSEAVAVAEGRIGGLPVVAAAFDFGFMGGSMGIAVGEALLVAARRAVGREAALVVVPASGGARMQEGILSLMQMPRTTIAVQRLRDAGLPYIVVLTDPTTGGVTASYAMLGDIHIAEPGAHICFAGPRVIQQTIREQLPEGFQRAEYLLAHGMIDMVVHRHKMRETLSRICQLMMVKIAPAKAADRGKGKQLNGKHYLNGRPVDPQLIEAVARVPSQTPIEPEILGPDERFDAARLEPREKTRKDEGQTGRPQSKDGKHP